MGAGSKEAEVARRRLFRWLGDDGRAAVLCAHATAPTGFSKDPVFPDRLGRRGYADRLRAVASVGRDSSGVRVARKGRVVTLAYGEHEAHIGARAFERVERAHGRNAGDGADFSEDVWRAVYRYRTLGMFSGMSASVPPEMYRRIRAIEPRATECFASFFNHTLEGGYMGLFPDVEAGFGCRGSFFRMTRPLPLMLCNPPFERCVLNAFVDHLLRLLSAGPGAALVVLPAFDTADRRRLNSSAKCKEKYPVDYETDVETERLKASPFTVWHALFCKETFPFVEMSTGKKIAYTSTLVIYASSYKRPRAGVADAIRRALPEPDVGRR